MMMKVMVMVMMEVVQTRGTDVGEAWRLRMMTGGGADSTRYPSR